MRRAMNGHYIRPMGVEAAFAGLGAGEVSVTPGATAAVAQTMAQAPAAQQAVAPAAAVPLNVSPAGRSGNAKGAALAVAKAQGAPTHLGERMLDRSYITVNPLNRRFPRALVASLRTQGINGLADGEESWWDSWGSDLFTPIVKGVGASIPGVVNAAVGNKTPVPTLPPQPGQPGYVAPPAPQTASMGTSLLLYGALGVGAIVVLSMLARRNA